MHFGCRNVPEKKVICLWLKKIREHKTVGNVNLKVKHGNVKTDHLIQPGQMSVWIQANFDQVLESVRQTPKKSLGRRSQELGIKMGSFTRETPKTVPLKYPSQTKTDT